MDSERLLITHPNSALHAASNVQNDDLAVKIEERFGNVTPIRNTESPRTGFSILILAACLPVILALAFAQPAHAEVKKADLIGDASVESRGLSVSQCPSIEAAHAVLMGKNGTVYFSRSAQDPAQIASITKVMTAIVALENAPSDTFVAVSEAAATIGESTAGLQAGDVMDLESALKALLIPSGNDAAQALAESVGASMIAANPDLGKDPVRVFVDAMNAKAAKIGCKDTVYANPHGLDDGQFEGDLHSTALDQALVAQCAMENDTIRRIVSGGSDKIQVTRGGAKAEVELQTTDELLEMYEFAIGVKTGVTNLAGPSFMGAANKEGRELYAIVLNSSDELQRFVDAKELFSWAYQHVVEVPLANSDEWLETGKGGTGEEVPVIVRVAHGDWVDKTVAATLRDPQEKIEVFDLDGNVSQDIVLDELHGSIHAGDKVGTISFKQKNAVIHEEDLVACEDVEAPNVLESIGVWWQRSMSALGGDGAQADSKVYNVMPIISNNVSQAA